MDSEPICSQNLRLLRQTARGRIYLAPRTWAVTGVRGQLADPRGGGFSHPRVLALPTATNAPDLAALGLMLAKGLVATLYDPVPHTDPNAVTGLGARLDPATASR